MYILPIGYRLFDSCLIGIASFGIGYANEIIGCGWWIDRIGFDSLATVFATYRTYWASVR